MNFKIKNRKSKVNVTLSVDAGLLQRVRKSKKGINLSSTFNDMLVAILNER